MKLHLPILAFSALAVNTIQTLAAPPTGSIKLISYSYSGTGCPQGSANLGISNDGGVLSFTSDYTWYDQPLTGARVNCMASINLSVPQGFQSYLNSAQLHGYTQLQQGFNITY